MMKARSIDCFFDILTKIHVLKKALVVLKRRNLVLRFGGKRCVCVCDRVGKWVKGIGVVRKVR